MLFIAFFAFFLFLLSIDANLSKVRADALPYYGEITANRADQVVVKFHTLEDDKFMICSVTNSSCSQATTSSPDLYQSLGLNTIDKTFYTSIDGNLILIEQGDSLYNNTNYSLNSSTSTTPISVPARVDRAMISGDNSKILFFINGGLILYDIHGQTFSKIIPFSWKGYDHYSFSPQGNYLAYYQSGNVPRTKRTYGIYDLNKQRSYEYSEVVKYWDHIADEYPIFSFSPDESRFLYLSDTSGYIGPYETTLPFTSSTSHTFHAKKVFMENFSTLDATYISQNQIALIDNHISPVNWSFDVYNTDNQSISTKEMNVSYGASLNNTGKFISYSYMTPSGERPAIFDLITQNIIHISPSFPIDPTSIINPLISIYQLQNGTSAILWKPNAVGNTNNATNTLPENNLIVWLHGGPDRQASIGYHPYLSYGVFDWVLERLRQQGNYILSLDYPGSYGYGTPFTDAISKNVGKKDVQDVLSAISQIKNYITVKDTYLMGNSYGAYLSLRTLVEKPKIFKGAISINGVTNWYTLTHTDNPSPFEVYFGQHPKSPANDFLYYQSSINRKISNITTQSILLFHGDSDNSVPYEQSKTLNANLIAQGKNVYFTTYANEDHVYAKKSSVSDLCQKILNFVGGNGTIASSVLTQPQATCLLP